MQGVRDRPNNGYKLGGSHTPWCSCELYIYGVGRVRVQILRGSRGPGSCYSCFVWMYLERACSLACPPNLWWYQLLGFSSSVGLSPWFHGTLGNTEAKLKLTTFSSLLLFLPFLFTWPPSGIVPLSTACWGHYLIIIITYIIRRFTSILDKVIFWSYHRTCNMWEEMNAICLERTEIQFQCV